MNLIKEKSLRTERIDIISKKWYNKNTKAKAFEIHKEGRFFVSENYRKGEMS